MFAVLGIGGTGGGGWVAWDSTHEAPPDVEERVEAIEIQVDKLEDIAVEQQIQISDGFEYLGDKLDAISPAAQDVEEPETMVQAKAKADRERARRDLFDE